MLLPWTAVPVALLVFLVPTLLLGHIPVPGLDEVSLRVLGMGLGSLGAVICLFAGFTAYERRRK